MSQSTADIVICGAGIAGISAAYHLAVHHGVRNVLLVDERPPMSLTSDKSTEAYRNWWPGPDDAMLRFMNRSIDLLEQLDDANDHRHPAQPPRLSLRHRQPGPRAHAGRVGQAGGTDGRRARCASMPAHPANRPTCPATPNTGTISPTAPTCFWTRPLFAATSPT